MGTIKHLWMDYRIFLPKYRVVIETPVVASVCFTAEFYHMTEEIFNDAVYFKNQAESLPPDLSNAYERRRYSRASILFSFIAIECFINEFIDKLISDSDNLKKVPSSDKRGLAKNWLPITKRLKLCVKLITGKHIDEGGSAYKRFIWLRDLRDAQIHSHGGANIYSEDISIIYGKNEIATVDDAKKGIEAIKAIIKEIHKLEGTDYPRFIDTIQ